MTREEAIKIIDCYDIGFYDLSGEKIPADKLANAFDMAIEALSSYDELYEKAKEVNVMANEILNDFPSYKEALSQPIVAKHFDIQSGYIYCSPQIAENVKVVVRCKDCRWQEECSQFVVLHKFCGVYQEISFCSHGERREPDKCE